MVGDPSLWVANPKVVSQLLSMEASEFSHASGTLQLTGSSGPNAGGLTDSQPTSCPSPPIAGMNSAHSWHTVLLRDRRFAVDMGVRPLTSQKRVYQD